MGKELTLEDALDDGIDDGMLDTGKYSAELVQLLHHEMYGDTDPATGKPSAVPLKDFDAAVFSIQGNVGNNKIGQEIQSLEVGSAAAGELKHIVGLSHAHRMGADGDVPVSKVVEGNPDYQSAMVGPQKSDVAFTQQAPVFTPDAPKIA